MPTPTVRLLLFGLILAPNVPATPVVAAMKLLPRRSAVVTPVAADDGCFRPEAYRELATLPPGLAVAETDLGAFVLVYTRSAVLAAPYHRADKGILAADAIFSAPPERARLAARASGATYVLTCPAHGSRDATAFGAQSLRAVLARGQTPGWLRRLSSASSAIQIFQVRP